MDTQLFLNSSDVMNGSIITIHWYLFLYN